MKLLMIEWHDAFTHCEQPWYTKEELMKETTGHQTCFSVGWLFREQEDYITLTMTKGDGSSDDNGEVGLALTIPKGMIVRIEELNVLQASIIQ